MQNHSHHRRKVGGVASNPGINCFTDPKPDPEPEPEPEVTTPLTIVVWLDQLDVSLKLSCDCMPMLLEVQLSLLDEGDVLLVSEYDEEVDDAEACPDPLPLPVTAIVSTVTPASTFKVVTVVAVDENASLSDRAEAPLEIVWLPLP